MTRSLVNGIPSPPDMVLFPHAKINLGLNVVARRPDGYHELETVMVPIPLHDALELIVDPSLGPGQVVFTRTGLPVPGDLEGDLCWKAVQAIARDHPLPGLRMHLHKVVPMGAGLGGGSSDAAHALIGLNDLLGLGLRREQLHALAGELGSDCPFFLERGAQIALGRGERLSPIALDLTGWWLLLVNPGEHVGTAEIYRQCRPTGALCGLADRLLTTPVEHWYDGVFNSLEDYVLESRPVVARLKERIQQAGAAYAAMSGSGSTVFGLFRQPPPELDWPAGHTAWRFAL